MKRHSMLGVTDVSRAHAPTIRLGRVERVIIYATMLWISVFAVSLLRGAALSPGINDEDSRWPR